MVGSVHLSILLCSILFAGGTRGPNDNSMPQQENPDAFQVLALLPQVVAISDFDNDGDFECLTGELTQMDMKKKEATYVLKFKGHHGTQKRNVAFHITPGPTTNSFAYIPNNDPSYTQVIAFPYTNQKNCVIAQGVYYQDKCVLFVSKQTVDDVPKECVDHFASICGVAVPMYGEDFCDMEEIRE
ncbi:uncharacterized protein LOC144097479 [Amblyomma americanum]